MYRFLSKLLKDNKNLKWDPEIHRIACMNHVINLAVQAFLKSIKGLVVTGSDEEIEFSMESVDKEPDTEGFAMAMWKIRSFTKVPPITDVISTSLKSFFMSLLYIY
jgi:hypothetical protein